MTATVYAWPKSKNKRENPYNFLVYRDIQNFRVVEFDQRKFVTNGASILHVHWPDRLLDDKRKWRLKWRFSRFLKAVDNLHRSGGRLVWTVHNLQSREIRYPDLADRLLREFIGKVDGFIFLSLSGKKLFHQRYGEQAKARSEVIPHPHYRQVYTSCALSVSRKHFGIDDNEFVLGFFGKIRSNKGLDTLVSLIKNDRRDKVRLLLAGSPNKRQISDALTQHLNENIDTIALFRHIDADEVGKVVGACNALIFPYADILNSGSSILALSLGRPIIVPNIGSFPELQEKVGKRWVYLYDQPLDEKKLSDAIAWVKAETDLATLPDLSFADPSRVSEMTEQFYFKVLNR